MGCAATRLQNGCCYVQHRFIQCVLSVAAGCLAARASCIQLSIDAPHQQVSDFSIARRPDNTWRPIRKLIIWASGSREVNARWWQVFGIQVRGQSSVRAFEVSSRRGTGPTRAYAYASCRLLTTRCGLCSVGGTLGHLSPGPHTAVPHASRVLARFHRQYTALAPTLPRAGCMGAHGAGEMCRQRPLIITCTQPSPSRHASAAAGELA